MLIKKEHRVKEAIKKKINESPRSQINLQKSEIKDDDIKEITSLILEIKPQIEELFLDNNKLENDGAIQLAKQLAFLPNLKYLDLQFNQIDTPGLEAIFELKVRKGVQLALHGNKVNNTQEIKEIEDRVRRKCGLST